MKHSMIPDMSEPIYCRDHEGNTRAGPCTNWHHWWEDGMSKQEIAKHCQYQPNECPICDDELCLLCDDAYDCEHDVDQRHGWDEAILAPR